jgi:hypothetical protein
MFAATIHTGTKKNKTLAALPGRSFLIDGEAIVTNDKGLAVFDLIRRARDGGAAALGEVETIDVAGPLRLVLQLERVPCLPQ